MDIARDSKKITSPEDVNSVARGRRRKIPFNLSRYLNDVVGNTEISAPKVGGTRIRNRNGNNESFVGASTDVATLKNQFRTIVMDKNDAIFCQNEINDLASFLLLNDFQSNVTRFWRSIQWQLIGDIIKTLINKFNNSKYNMIYLSSCFVCVFRMMTEQSPVPADQIKSRLTRFVDVIRQFINHFDYALWKKWFFCYGRFVDWIFFVAGVFMPDENFVGAHDKSIVNNAMTYFKMIKRHQYAFKENIRKNPMSGRSDMFELSVESDTDRSLTIEYDTDRTKSESRSTAKRIRGRFVKKNATSAAGDKTKKRK